MKQTENILLTECPWCGSVDIKQGKTIIDFFLTKEKFALGSCDKCGLVFTNPRPKSDNLSRYYESDKYYSHTSNQAGIIPFIYRRIKEINLKTKFKQVTIGLTGGKVLDIGCGTGDFLAVCQRAGFEVSGIEPNPMAAEFAAAKIHRRIFDPSQSNELLDSEFDLITMWHVLEHVSDLKVQILELYRLTKSGGKVVIALPNYLSFDAMHYDENWAAWDVPRHLYHFSKQVIDGMMKENGFESGKCYPMKWDAFYVSMLSEQNRGSALGIVRAFAIGLISNIRARRKKNYSSMVYTYFKK
ncbi:MAG: methyltransferase domain-containing protein [Bacteroidales bacterium]|nr:methyltransferase domain-containing protein [Bacteroidales bacterium]